MAGKVVPAASFDYEIVGDPESLRPAVSSSSAPWIDPVKLKLRHRIGRGPFGDVWLATHHQSTDDYDEFHEVAVKMLHPVNEGYSRAALDKFNVLFHKCRRIGGLCLLNGVSIINGKICIVMKFYDGSIGDKMAQLKGGKLSLQDVLRYGIQLAQTILELHAQETLLLNLKPSNFLLNENDQAILGDVGIPYLLLGIPLPSSDMARKLGTPNYMAPEQWQPEVRGSISLETDSWGFGCSILEMLTGVQPWSGKSVEEIYNFVVIKQEKPRVPEGLPSPVENVLRGCFDYDLRNRPLMSDLLHVFRSSLNSVSGAGSWTEHGNLTIPSKSNRTGYTEWFLAKDHLQVGDMVRSRKPPNVCKLTNMEIPEGVVVGDTDGDGAVLVRVHGVHDPVRVPVSTLERVTFGLAAGDWVRLREEDRRHSAVGILHSIHRDGTVAVSFIGLETLWKGNSSDLQMAEPYCVGQFVKVKANVLSPRFEWARKRGGTWATGRIWRILPNGCLVVKFPGRLTFGEEHGSFLADPAQVEAVSFETCQGVVRKYQHLEDIHWAVRPLLVALGLFTAMKVGLFVGTKMGRSKVKRHESNKGESGDGQTGDNSCNAVWLPPKVANMLGVSTTGR